MMTYRGRGHIKVRGRPALATRPTSTNQARQNHQSECRPTGRGKQHSKTKAEPWQQHGSKRHRPGNSERQQQYRSTASESRHIMAHIATPAWQQDRCGTATMHGVTLSKQRRHDRDHTPQTPELIHQHTHLELFHTTRRLFHSFKEQLMMKMRHHTQVTITGDGHTQTHTHENDYVEKQDPFCLQMKEV